jgi:hypothetical protein
MDIGLDYVKEGFCGLRVDQFLSSSMVKIRKAVQGVARREVPASLVYATDSMCVEDCDQIWWRLMPNVTGRLLINYRNDLQ